MKNLVLGFLALTLALWVVAGAQALPQQSGNQQSQTDQNQATQSVPKTCRGALAQTARIS